MDIEIRKYLRLVSRWWWLLLLGAILPMAVSYYFASQESDFYQAKATIMVGTSIFQDPDPDTRQLSLSNTLAAAYAELVRQGPVTGAVIERLGLDRSPEQLAMQIATGIRSGAQLLEIYVTDTNPQAAALIANALADELIRRSPASGASDPAQQEFIRRQLEELQGKIERIGEQIDELTASLSELTSAADIQDVQGRIDSLEDVRLTYHSTYANLLDSYGAEASNLLSFFEPAVVPQSPMPSKTKLIVAVAGAAGLGLMLSAIFLIEYLDTSVRWEGRGAQSILELSVLGAIPRVSRRRSHLSSDPLSPLAESIRVLRTNVFLVRPEEPFRTLLLTSPVASEGKGFILANLALALAAAGNRVVVVDADMRRPTLHEIFDRPNLVGLADVLRRDDDGGELEGDGSLASLQETDFDDLYLLSAGHPPVDPATLLTSPRFGAVLESLKDHGDVILIDSPPVLGPPDATVLATHAEGTILIVSSRRTKREDVLQAKARLLAQQEVNLLGLTINCAKLDGNVYSYSGHRENGQRRGKQGDGEEGWLTLGGAAAYLGISKQTARRWRKTGRLKGQRSGLRWRFSREDLERLAHTPEYSDPVEEDAQAPEEQSS